MSKPPGWDLFLWSECSEPPGSFLNLGLLHLLSSKVAFKCGIKCHYFQVRSCTSNNSFLLHFITLCGQETCLEAKDYSTTNKSAWLSVFIIFNHLSYQIIYTISYQFSLHLEDSLLPLPTHFQRCWGVGLVYIRRTYDLIILTT